MVNEIHSWTITARERQYPDDNEVLYICKHTHVSAKDPHGYCYLLKKVHNEIVLSKPIPTRPVSSNCASVTNPIGKWVDDMLQPIMKSIQTYLKNLFVFKKLIDNLGRLDSIAKLVTTISTNIALRIISKYLCDKGKFYHHYAKTLVEAIEIAKKNDIVKFCNLYTR